MSSPLFSAGNMPEDVLEELSALPPDQRKARLEEMISETETHLAHLERNTSSAPQQRVEGSASKGKAKEKAKNVSKTMARAGRF